MLDLSKKQLGEQLVDLGLAPYRAKQVWSWLYAKGATDFGAMTSLSVAHRALLDARFVVDGGAPLGAALVGADGTRKWLSRFRDGRTAESVFIPTEQGGRGTLCVSSQVGCSLACSFCHTGTQPLLRNLTAGEIVGQLLTARRALGDLPLDPRRKRAVTNIVFMGEGEPMYNYRHVLGALRTLTDGEGAKVGGRSITVSTSGVIPAIARLGRDMPAVNLAISLHATTDELRSQIMAINRTNPLGPLLAACKDFARGAERHDAAADGGGERKRRRRRVTFEYVMLEGVNDSDADAERLMRLVGGMPSLVNLIPFNAWEGAPYRSSDRATIERFAARLERGGQYVTVRWPRGDDILAACGQLNAALGTNGGAIGDGDGESGGGGGSALEREIRKMHSEATAADAGV